MNISVMKVAKERSILKTTIYQKVNDGEYSDAVIPLIKRLSRQYTEYELKQVNELQSEYSTMLYELMM